MLLSFYFLSILLDVEEVIDMAKRKLEKERELYMSKSLPGFPGDSQPTNENENENESDSDDESDESEEKGIKNVDIIETRISISYLNYIF